RNGECARARSIAACQSVVIGPDCMGEAARARAVSGCPARRALPQKRRPPISRGVPMLRACLATALAISAAGCATVSGPAAEPALSEATMKEVTRVLSSDEFEGRAPGTPGEEKTLAYLVE